MASNAPPPALVLFDGDCAFCSRSMRFIARRDRARRLRFASLDSETARAALASHPSAHALTPTPPRPASVLLVTEARVLDRSDAALAIAARLHFPWPLAAAIGALLPKPIRDTLYDFVARHRHRLGRPTTCPLPATPQGADGCADHPAPSSSLQIHPSETNQSPS
ncbi:MAG: hypothetical protein RIS86_1318 [Planctomycetota bacterium]|jgi:predicted DCC family thiol-disulfide oxidoreductase YuxK